MINERAIRVHSNIKRSRQHHSTYTHTHSEASIIGLHGYWILDKKHIYRILYRHYPHILRTLHILLGWSHLPALLRYPT